MSKKSVPKKSVSKKLPSPAERAFRNAVKKTLKQWNASLKLTNSTLAHLGVVQIEQRASDCSPRQAAQQVLNKALKKIEKQYSEQINLLRSHYIEGNKVVKLADEAGLAESTVFRKIQKGLDYLIETVQQMEQESDSDQKQTHLLRLPPSTYRQLVGVEAHLKLLRQKLSDPDSSWLISISGLGGMGKTALADALARQIISEEKGTEVVWVTAKSQILRLSGEIQDVAFPPLSCESLIESIFVQVIGQRSPSFTFDDMLKALTNRMKRFRYVIFVDNLETVEDFQLLLPTLRKLVDPSHIILTTRHSLLEEEDIYHFILPSLNEEYTLQLVRLEAAHRRLPHVLGASEAELLPIFERVGGNPLAIRLVVGQLHVHSLDRVLEDLLEVRRAEASALYTFIYHRAWKYLEEVERNTLLAMPMVPETGGTFDFLAAITQIPENDLQNAVNRLVTLNLIDVRSDLHSPRYTIHSLTRSFLHRQVALWDE